MTIKTNDQEVKTLLSQFFTQDMVYQKALPLVVGHGKMKRRIPRRVGTSADSFFAVELMGDKDAVRQLKFMTLADNDPPAALARSLVAIRGVVESVMPDWGKWDRLQAEIQQNRDATIDGVRATFSQLTDNVRVLFVTVG